MQNICFYNLHGQVSFSRIASSCTFSSASPVQAQTNASTNLPEQHIKPGTMSAHGILDRPLARRLLVTRLICFVDVGNLWNQWVIWVRVC